MTEYRLKRKLRINVTPTKRATMMDAVRFFPGLSWERFLELPGDPQWCTPDCPISKADVMIYYIHTTMYEAIRDEMSMEQK